MRSTEASGLQSSSFRFEPVTEELKERMAEKSWTTIEVNSIALELRDRLSGLVVHVDDIKGRLCNEGRLYDLLLGRHQHIVHVDRHKARVLRDEVDPLHAASNHQRFGSSVTSNFMSHFTSSSSQTQVIFLNVLSRCRCQGPISHRCHLCQASDLGGISSRRIRVFVCSAAGKISAHRATAFPRPVWRFPCANCLHHTRQFLPPSSA